VIALLFALCAGPPTGPILETALLDGRRLRGELLETTKSSVVIQSDGRRVELPQTDVLRLDFRPVSPAKTPLIVRLTDGSRFGAQSFESDGRTAKTVTALGALAFAIENVSSVLLIDDPQETAEFAARAADKLKTDRIVIAREGKRLVLDGVIGKVGADKIEFTLDGDLLPINRSRGRALYFAQKATGGKPAAMIADRRGDLWAAVAWRWQSGGVTFKSAAGFERSILAPELSSIDLSSGRVAYLSDLEPALMQHTPGFDHPWLIQHDRGPHGRPLELDGRKFAKGLTLHSRTIVEYDLGGEYRRFQAQVGVPTAAGPSGDADVRIVADEKTLWRKRVRAGENSQPVDFPIASVKRLRLAVDFGGNLDLGDHVAFADAKVVK